VCGASRLAAAVGVSPLVIGLTVVRLRHERAGAGGQHPGALSGNADIAIGNVSQQHLQHLMIIGTTSLLRPGGLRVAPSLRNFDMM